MNREDRFAFQGGAVHVEKSSVVTVSGAEFSNNQAGDGGAVFVAGAESTSFSCSKSKFDTNSASGQGGSVRLSSLSADFEDCTFTKCWGEMGGGCISMTGSSSPSDIPSRVV